MEEGALDSASAGEPIAAAEAMASPAQTNQAPENEMEPIRRRPEDAEKKGA